MYRTQATTDEKRIEHLKTILTHRDLTNRQGQLLLGESRMNRKREIAEQLETAFEERNRIRAARREAGSKRDRQRDRIIPLIRAARSNLTAMIRAGIIEVTRYTRYGLSVKGKRPDPATTRAWLSAAKPIIEETEIEITTIGREAFQTEI